MMVEVRTYDVMLCEIQERPLLPQGVSNGSFVGSGII
jgi:hypothetical protein